MDADNALEWYTIHTPNTRERAREREKQKIRRGQQLLKQYEKSWNAVIT